jgi:hypothetical protein
MDLIDIIKFRQWPQLPQLPPRYTIALGPSGGVPTSTGPGRLTTTAGRGGPGGGATPRREAPRAPGASTWRPTVSSWRGSSGRPNASVT